MRNIGSSNIASRFLVRRKFKKFFDYWVYQSNYRAELYSHVLKHTCAKPPTDCQSGVWQSRLQYYTGAQNMQKKPLCGMLFSPFSLLSITVELCTQKHDSICEDEAERHLRKPSMEIQHKPPLPHYLRENIILCKAGRIFKIENWGRTKYCFPLRYYLSWHPSVAWQKQVCRGNKESFQRVSLSLGVHC